jgi:hypothetical protein
VIIALALLGYAVLLLTAGPGALARARWPEGAPRLAIAAWLALTGSAVASVLAGRVALMVPTVRVMVDRPRQDSPCSRHSAPHNPFGMIILIPLPGPHLVLAPGLPRCAGYPRAGRGRAAVRSRRRR